MFTTGVAITLNEDTTGRDTFRIQRDNGAYFAGWLLWLPLWVNDIHQAHEYKSKYEVERDEKFFESKHINVWVLKDAE